MRGFIYVRMMNLLVVCPLLNCAGEVNVKEPASRLNNSSPRLFSGFGDFDSPSPTIGTIQNFEYFFDVFFL